MRVRPNVERTSFEEQAAYYAVGGQHTQRLKSSEFTDGTATF